MALDDKFKPFCFLLFLGDSICSHECWYQILHKIQLLFHIPLLKYPNKWNMTSSWRTRYCFQTCFCKNRKNNLLCVVLIKTIVFDNVHNYLISKTTFHSLFLKCVPGILKYFRSANNDLDNLYSQVFYPFLFRLNK